MSFVRQLGTVEVRVDIPEDRIFFCENEQKFVRWPEDFWPLYCPICGRGVHAHLSSHHEVLEGFAMTEIRTLGDSEPA